MQQTPRVGPYFFLFRPSFGLRDTSDTQEKGVLPDVMGGKSAPDGVKVDGVMWADVCQH